MCLIGPYRCPWGPVSGVGGGVGRGGAGGSGEDKNTDSDFCFVGHKL